ncbi:unnamed protein product [Nippostrongylus brasiliensis]|uniref:Peptidase A2 domain-containing protein n=1 Tax=Nippostrongylus brasiliensis TaxID=27835 RepID=A0A0N4YKZ0_NIPBR|nr:unnamed protein product [Nippostrongylus brasiliensis]
MTAEGSIWNHRKSAYEKVLFFFDCGAQKTIIQEDVATKLGLPRQTTEICTMSGIGGHIEKFESHIVEARVSTVFGEELQFKFQTKPVITNGFPSVKLTSTDVNFLKANNICLANSKLRGEHQTPHILVGLDYFHELVIHPVNGERTPTGLHIAKTIFGPTVYGKGSIPQESAETTCYGLTAVCEPELDEKALLQRMFELEGLGISEAEYQSDEKVHKYLEQYSKRISFEGGHITAPFPLKDNVSELEDNYSIAIRRLHSLQTALTHNDEQRRWYCKIIEKYQQEGMIETIVVLSQKFRIIEYIRISTIFERSNSNVIRKSRFFEHSNSNTFENRVFSNVRIRIFDFE